MQLQADFLGCKLRRSEFTEATSLGAVFAAGPGVGVWIDFYEIEKVWKLGREFTADLSNSFYKSP